MNSELLELRAKAFDYLFDAVVVVDLQGLIIDWNKGSEDLYGYSKEEIINKHVSILHVPEDIDRVTAEVISEVEKSGKWTGEVRMQHKTGRVGWVESMCIPFFDNEDQVIGTFGINRDISARKFMEEELLKSRHLDSVGILAGGIAHDFNNINGGLFGYIELAMEKITPEHEAYDYLQTAHKALIRATSLTQRLLTFAKGGAPILEILDIKHVIQDSVDFTLSGSNVRTDLNLSDDLWLVKADKGQLYQVITNLTLNGIQAMPEGGTLYIEAKNIKDFDNSNATHLSGEVIKLSIRDEGVGISSEHVNKIFDPYFTTKAAGRGIGLATVQSIINKHNGIVTVDSELGVGTNFTIYLPVDSSLPQTFDTISSDVTDEPDTTAGHVLVMDDEEMILNLSVDIIESFGYTVDTAIDGKEAKEKFIAAKNSGKAFDVVIMDLTIPGGMGGKEAVKEILAFDQEAKVIVSSGYSTDPVMVDYLEYGFKGRLAKPFQMKDLQKELSLHIVEE
jgi:PAS domain S-box-containing protein